MMLILSNALTNVVDEGSVKVANSLVKCIKKKESSTKIITFDRESNMADEHLTANKFLLNRKLLKKVRNSHNNVLYIPFPARPFSTSVRTFILSLFAGRNFRVILSMTNGMTFASKLLFKLSGAKLMVLSKRSFNLYSAAIGEKHVTYLKTGVDTNRFAPVTEEDASALKRNYGFDPNKKLILHVGHLNRGRNVQQLKKLADAYEVLLISSTLTKDEQDLDLKKELMDCGVRVIDSYIPNIEQVYQMADVYFFPVTEDGNCIDVPLSCLEAAACNKPIVTTDYGEMREFAGKEGFFFIDSFEPSALAQVVAQALDAKNLSTRTAVMDYDWKHAVSFLTD